jgi:Tfp pilus assembly PilM family ATPase
MWHVPFKPPALVGIAIQPETIHLVQLKKARKGYLLERVRRYALEKNIFSEGKISAFAELKKQLADMVKREDLQGVRAAVCVPASQVNMQRMTLPKGLSAQDIEAEISVYAQRSLPVKTENLAMDYRLSEAGQPQEIDVFFAAARKDYIDNFQSCLRAAGLQVKMIDVDIFALLRAARYALHDELPKNEAICALYLGADDAVIAAQRDKEILFHQQWHGHAAPHAQTRQQWLDWCCHTWQHVNIDVVAIGGHHKFINEAAAIMAARWRSKIFEPDPFMKMTGASGVDKAVIHDSPSAFLLACGLAMREVRPW